MKKITSIDIDSKTVIVRVDFNVPIKNGKVTDNTRIVESLKTIKYLRKHDAKIILLSHMGKIKSKEDKVKNTLLPVKHELEKLLKVNVCFSKENYGNKLKQNVEKLNYGEILLVENTRYLDVPDNLESNCDEKLSRFWASLADIFVMDAFGSIHRKHASTYGISKYLPTVAGFLVIKEIEELNKVMKVKKNIILGGIKVSDKLGLIKNLINNTENILIGGAMCGTFLKAKGYGVGKTIVDNDKLEFCKSLLKDYKNKICLPIDVITENGIRDIENIKSDETIYDIGPKTILLFLQKLDSKLLVLINGTMGLYENDKYETGTKNILKYLYNKKYKVIVCGGDTSNAVKKYNYKFDYISTGGGASLNYLSGTKMEALEMLKKKKTIVLNHKSYLGYAETLDYISKLKLLNNSKCDIIVMPSILYLTMYKDKDITIGSQNFYSHKYGSYTGEISLSALKSLDINYCLVGHSERIKYNLDTYSSIREKLYKSLNFNFKTILCIGEMKKINNPLKFIKKELDYMLENIEKSKIYNLIIAYEPSWAIGTGISLDIESIEKINKFIKNYFMKKYNLEIDIYYGGSVNKNNIYSILDICDGVLIGKSSSDIEKVLELIKLI